MYNYNMYFKQYELRMNCTGANVIINEIKLRDNTSRGKEIIRLKILYLCTVYSSSLTQEKKKAR